MSGGAFDYAQYRIADIYTEIEDEIYGHNLYDEFDVNRYIEDHWLEDSEKEYVRKHHHTIPNRSEYSKETIKGNEDRLKENEALKNRYNAMLSKVRRWTPPSKEYEGVKDFMESQLIDSLDFDCRQVYVENIIPKDKWIQKQTNRTDLIESMKYNLEQYNKSVVAAEKDTLWLKTFSESIKKVTE